MALVFRLAGLVVVAVLAASLVSVPAARAADPVPADRAETVGTNGINPKKYKKKFTVRIRPHHRSHRAG